jgi:hypothetical protein
MRAFSPAAAMAATKLDHLKGVIIFSAYGRVEF